VTVDPARIPYVDAVPRFTIGAAGDVTVTVADPKIEPLVALTVLLNVPVAPPAVKITVSPVAPGGTVPPPAVTVQAGVNGVMTLPPASLPTAVNCCVVLIESVTGFGVTVIVASGPGVTMTVAVAEIPRQVASTVLVNVPGVAPAVKRPVLGLIVPPPETTDQTMVPALGVTLAPSKSVPDAVNCTVPFTATVAGFGATTSVDRTPGSVLSLHAVVNRPANANATIMRAIRARGACVRTIGLFMKLFIELPLPDACKRDRERTGRGPGRNVGIDCHHSVAGVSSTDLIKRIEANSIPNSSLSDCLKKTSNTVCMESAHNRRVCSL
jgi:hypothetical protein